MSHRKSIVIGMVWFFCIASAVLNAQQETASVAGQVLDPTGAVLPGAQIAVKNTATGALFMTQTDSAGLYRAPQLVPGVYDFSVSATGFKTVVREAVAVRVADRLRMDFSLQVGDMSERITVAAEAALLQTEDATSGQVIDNQKITELPLNGRNWLQLSTLAPGAVSYPGQADTGSGNSQAQLMNLGGTHSAENNYLLNGLDVTVYITSGGAAVTPPVDSLQEFKVQTNNYNADTGRLSGAVVNATIKSGGNSFHGSAYDFLRNRALNARNFFALPNQNKPEFTRNQFGGSLGGPVVRNKIFFFFNYEGNRQRQNQVATAQVLSDAQKAGDFSSSLGSQVGTDALGRPVRAGQIFDPFSVQTLPTGTVVRDSFPNNTIPASRMDPIARSLVSLEPRPNTAGSPNLVKDLSAPLDVNTYVGRGDWQLSAKDNFEAHVVYAKQSSFTAPILGDALDGGNSINLSTGMLATAASWVHVFRPVDLNELRLGYVRNASLRWTGQSNVDMNSKYGIPYPFPGTDAGGLAALQISGYTQLGVNLNGPFFQFQNKYEVADNYTMIRGSHTFSFGFLAMLKLFHNQKNCNNCRGTLTFNGQYTRQVGFANSGNAVADFLTGVPSQIQYANLTNEKDIGRDIDWYVQDKWQINRKLTVTTGMRYQYNPPSYEARGQMSSVLFDKGYVNPQVVVPGNANDATLRSVQTLFPFMPVRRADELNLGLTHDPKKNFAPRLGIAYQLGPKTVLRTGYGIFYGFAEQVNGAVLTVNPPSKVIISAVADGVNPTLSIGTNPFGANPFDRALTNPNFFSVRNPRIPPEFSQMYNLTLQRLAGRGWTVEVGFMGNHTSRLHIIRQVNDAVPALPGDNSSPQSRRRISSLLGNLPLLTPEGFSTYNAFIVNVEKRYSHGLAFLTNFTWSRALGVAPAYSQGINGASIQNPYDLAREYGPLEFDVVKRFAVSATYELPLGPGKRFLNHGGVASHVIGGWQVNGIGILQGGFPLTAGLGFSLGNTFTNSRPDAIADPYVPNPQASSWLKPSAFAIPTSAQIAAGDFFGNAGRGSIRGPGLVNIDLSLFKNFKLRESMRLQFRTEVFNAANTPYFGFGLSTDFSSPSFGKITQAGDPRVIQMALKLLF